MTTHTCDRCHGSGLRRGAVRTFDCPRCEGTGHQTAPALVTSGGAP